MRTAPYAAVNETVEIAGRARGLVNAILRRAQRESGELEAAVEAAGPSVAMSHPEFLIARWEATFGAEAAAQLLAWNNAPAEVVVRANELKTTFGELLKSTPGAEASPAHPLAIRVRHIPVAWLARGLCYVQDPSTLVACDLLAPQPGELVLDACAAPGGKTTYLAQLMRNEGKIVACDLYESRVMRLRENIWRLGVRNTQPLVHDCMLATPPGGLTQFDRILVDAPCTNTGVIRRRVDVRWRLSEEDFIRMPAQQLALLRRTATFLRRGGTLVYSTCSLEREENEQVVERLLVEMPDLRFIESRRTLPFVDAMDGAFAAKFTRV
jgi:16S rRNA (cytosine967-C5)-methyltransferase